MSRRPKRPLERVGALPETSAGQRARVGDGGGGGGGGSGGATETKDASTETEMYAPTTTVTERAIEELRLAARIGALSIENIKTIGLQCDRIDTEDLEKLIDAIATFGGAILQTGASVAVKATGKTVWGITPLAQHKEGVTLIRQVMLNATKYCHVDQNLAQSYLIGFELPLAIANENPQTDGQTFIKFAALPVRTPVRRTHETVAFHCMNTLLREDNQTAITSLVTQLRRHVESADGSKALYFVTLSILDYLDERVKVDASVNLRPYLEHLEQVIYTPRYMGGMGGMEGKIQRLLAIFQEYRQRKKGSLDAGKLDPALCELWCTLWQKIITNITPLARERLDEETTTKLIGIVDVFPFPKNAVPDCLMRLVPPLINVVNHIPRSTEMDMHYSHLLFYWWLQRIPAPRIREMAQIIFSAAAAENPWTTSWGFWENTLHDCIEKCGRDADALSTLDYHILLRTPKLVFARLFMVFRAARDDNGMKCCLRGLVVAAHVTKQGYVSDIDAAARLYETEALPPHMLRFILESVIREGPARVFDVRMLVHQLLLADSSTFGVDGRAYFKEFLVPEDDAFLRRLVARTATEVVANCPPALVGVQLDHSPVLSRAAMRFLESDTYPLKLALQQYLQPARPSWYMQDAPKVWQLEAPSVTDASLVRLEDVQCGLDDKLTLHVTHHVAVCIVAVVDGIPGKKAGLREEPLQDYVEPLIWVGKTYLRLCAIMKERGKRVPTFQHFRHAWMASVVLSTVVYARLLPSGMAQSAASILNTILYSPDVDMPSPLVIPEVCTESISFVGPAIMDWIRHCDLPEKFTTYSFMSQLFKVLFKAYRADRRIPDCFEAFIGILHCTRSEDRAQMGITLLEAIVREEPDAERLRRFFNVAAREAPTFTSLWVQAGLECKFPASYIKECAFPNMQFTLLQAVEENTQNIRLMLWHPEDCRDIKFLKHLLLWNAEGLRKGGATCDSENMSKDLRILSAVTASHLHRSFEDAGDKYMYFAWKALAACGVRFVPVEGDEYHEAWKDKLRKFAESDAEAAQNEAALITGTCFGGPFTIISEFLSEYGPDPSPSLLPLEYGSDPAESAPYVPVGSG